MARLAQESVVSEKLGGTYFVNETCIDCDLCRQTAPQFFVRKYAGAMGQTYVERQPMTVAEDRACRDALEACPVEAIIYKLD
jgi:ferredoxin